MPNHVTGRGHAAGCPRASGAETMTELITCRVHNRHNVIAAVTAVLAREAVDVHSVTRSQTGGGHTAVLTLAVAGAPESLDAAVAALRGCEQVLETHRLDRTRCLERELLLVTVAAGQDDIPLLMQVLETMRAKVSAMGHETITVETTGDQARISALLKLLERFEIRQCARSGPVAVGTTD